jgi:DNA-binding MarR family transcriptional regulator
MEQVASRAEQGKPTVEGTAEQFNRVGRRLRATAQEDWSSLSLSRAQLRILVFLHQDGPASVGQLANNLGVTLPSVTATVDRLVQAGYVIRADDPTDRRRVINQLTPEGTALIRRLHEGKRTRLIGALEQLSTEEIELFSQILAHLETILSEST